MGKAAQAITGASTLSHNLLGQRLGRKGRDTRERILAATEQLLEGSDETPISLSAVAREASLGMTTLYLYFSDLTELLLAVLEPIIASAEESYIAQLREPWPDERLPAHCLSFVIAYHAFWERHTHILHLRNNLADARDERMYMHRIRSSQPLIQLLIRQMAPAPTASSPAAVGTATVLVTGIDRLVTVTTDRYVSRIARNDDDVPSDHITHVLQGQARLLELAIRDQRAAARADRAPQSRSGAPSGK